MQLQKKKRLASFDTPEKEKKREKLDKEIATRISLNEKIKEKKFPIRRLTNYKNVRTVSKLSFNGEKLLRIIRNRCSC